jgi:uncharacterized protein YdbL (DUF1318 family)
MSKRSRFSKTFLTLLILLAVAAGAPAAWAQSRALDAPRAAGTVGERYDGYAVVRDQRSAGTLGVIVEQVNAERRKVYAERAQRENVAVDQVARVYAGEIFRSAPAGTWFLKEDGQWIRK